MLDGREHTILSNHLVRFEQLQSSLSNTGSHARALLNSEFARYAHETTNFNWDVYSFSNGYNNFLRPLKPGICLSQFILHAIWQREGDLSSMSLLVQPQSLVQEMTY